MKRILNIVLVLVVWMAVGNRSAAQTTVLGSLSDRHVNALKVYGDTLFAACGDGLYMKDLRKNDAWKVIAFEGRHITSMVKRGDDILAICKNIKYREDPSARYTSIVMTNIRSGQTEVCTPLWITNREATLKNLAQDNKNPDRVYVSCFMGENEELGVYEFEFIASDDFGQGWNTVAMLEGYVNVCQQTFGDASYLFGYNDNLDCYCPLLYSSTDRFQTVTFVGEFETNEEDREMIINNISISPTDGNRLLLSGHSGVALSRDGGVSWDFVTENTLAMAVFFDEANGQDAYFVKTVTSDGKKTAQLYRSSDGGETWALWQEEEGINPISIMMHQGTLYFQNALTGEVCQWPLKENVQRETALVKEGKRWEYVRGDVAPVFHYVYTLQGDTTICGKAYKKMYMSKDKGEPEYVSAMREEDGKVFKVSKGSEEERLLFDFNAEVGDVVYHRADDIVEMYLTVKDIDHVLVGDREQKRFVLTMTEILNNGTDRLEYPDDVIWVEGIGSIGLFDSPESVFGSGGGGWLLGCYEDDRMVFANEDFYPGQEISYEPLTIDDAQNTFGMTTCQLALAGSKVESCEDDCLVVADVNSGNKVRLFGMGCDFAEGTQLGGTIAGLLCVWNKMMTLFPTRFTDVSTILSDADGIRDVVDGENAHGESLYDLQGRFVGNGISHLKKGIYIIEGRKIVVR